MVIIYLLHGSDLENLNKLDIQSYLGPLSGILITFSFQPFKQLILNGTKFQAVPITTGRLRTPWKCDVFVLLLLTEDFINSKYL